VVLNAREQILRENQVNTEAYILPKDAPPMEGLVVRKHNLAQAAVPHTSHPLNYPSLRPVEPGFSPLDRAVRDLPWESRFDLAQRMIKPRYMSECLGTPRQQYQEGLVDGLRVRPVFNPYVRLIRKKYKRLDNWESRNWDIWDPFRTFVRGSRRRYNVPNDIYPYKDELGEWHTPRLNARYRADVEKQYAYFSLPWFWRKDFFDGRFHWRDREPKGLGWWYRQEFRRERIKEAMRTMDKKVEEYRINNRRVKRYSWFEQAVVDLAGSEVASDFLRQKRELSKI